jgi:hypothetical protein
MTRNEVPVLAKAILASVRGLATCCRGFYRDISYIWIFSNDSSVDMVVLASDWDKIVPYLKDSLFDPHIVPVPKVVVINPSQRFDEAVLDLSDEELYNRILNVLNNLFTVEFPTSSC